MVRLKGVRTAILFIFLPLFLPLFYSCENSGFLPPYEETLSGEILASVRSGSVLLDGEAITLDLEYDGAEGNAPNRLEIEIFDPEGESLGFESIVGTDLLEELPPVNITEDSHGLFVMKTRLYDDQESLVGENQFAFFKVENIPEISRIEVYPPEALSPNAKGLVIPEIDVADGAWLRWTMGSELLGRGPYEQYKDGFIWQAPSYEGVFSVLLEVFPEYPADIEGGFEFDSSIRAEIQFFVQEKRGSSSSELGPGELYRNLFHLRGSLRDTGELPVQPRVVGDPLPAVKDGTFGYRFGGEDALILPEMDLSNIETGGLAPFSIKMILNPDRTEQFGRHILSFSSSGEGVLLFLAVDQGGLPYLSFPGTSSERYGVDSFDWTRCREMVLSFLPGPEEVLVKWYCNGKKIASHGIAKDVFPLLSGGALQLGGEIVGMKGFESVVDEFGLFYRESDGRYAADEQVLLRWLRRNLGESSILGADGFEAEEDDAVVIATGEEKDLLVLKPEWSRAIVHICFQEDPEILADASIVFRGALGKEAVVGYEEPEESGGSDGTAGSEPLEYSLSIAELMARGGDLQCLPGRSTIILQFSRSGGACSINTAAGVRIHRTDIWGNDPVEVGIRLENKGSEDSENGESSGVETFLPVAQPDPQRIELRVEEVFITKERSNVAARERVDFPYQKVASTLNQR